MGESMIKDIVQEYQSGIDVAISSQNRTFEDGLIRDNPHLNISNIPQSYRRYGYGLLSYVAKKFVFDWFKDFGKTGFFDRVQAKMTNSGMSSIDLALTSLSTVLGKRQIVAPKNLYFATDELLKSYQDTLFREVIRFDTTGDLESLLSNLKDPKILYLEICSNSPDMTFWDEDSIKRYSKLFKYLVLDGTLIGSSRINPKIFENGNVIYIESLSKNYHLDSSSKLTSGIVVYPKNLEESLQKRFYCSGAYLQLSCLMEVPIEFYDVGKERVMEISSNVQEFYRNAKEICCDDRVKISRISDSILNIPLVLFLDFHERERLEIFIKKSELKQRGSFGHDDTYILPIGLMWDTAPPGLARIAFGKKPANPKLYKALKEVNN